MLACGTIKLFGMDEKLDLTTGLRRSKLTHLYLGDIEAESRFECLAFANANGASNFVGLEYLNGRIGNRVGGFILQHIGSVKSGQSISTLNVVSGSGTGDFAGIRGHGRTTWSTAGADASQVLLEYSFESDNKC
ncbi:DUF3224 domain-containing protein [Undibacterium fentianense]|uniref:DUF3224 domain-containing protein n=1 Tax=Undibacterium fentianense TaxID=2828728 RepID=A0A941DX31_9BURK|nr:DUF3224 domain-containing protein [Undibacterium fentianense]MBR7798395.1 DUF3224 domain-containing protein [Undibacterium fentianense]